MTESPAPAAAAPTPAGPGRRSLRNAWISVAAIAVGFLLALVIGQALASLLGYDSASGEAAPIGVLLGAGLPAVLVMVTPAIFATVFGFRARRQGEPSGLIPAILGIAAVVWAILTNTLPLLITAL